MILRLCFCAILLVFGVHAAQTARNSQDDFEMVKKGVREYLITKQVPDYFTKALENYQLTHIFRQNMVDVYDNQQTCDLCVVTINALLELINLGPTDEELLDGLAFICVVLGIESDRVCRPVIDIQMDSLLYIIRNKENFTADSFCGDLLQSFNCPSGGLYDWTINIPPGNSLDRPELDNPSDQTFTVLQISDIHYDPVYVVGGNADCGDPLCCQFDQGDPLSEEFACGYWSDYRDADAPWHLVEEAIRQTTTVNPDYVYFTGDIMSHRVWDTSIANNTRDFTKVVTYFRDSYGVTVFPIFGNHEPHPVNIWTSESVGDLTFDDSWLFQLAADQWSPWLGDETRETILKGGYYTVSPRPGFRIIGLNGNVCYTYNWWLMYENFDPWGQLQWLANTLLLAEENNESVHILTHIPTGSGGCLASWGREYRRIVERFANTITGQFNGHTHSDEFHIYYNHSSPLHALGVAFNGASLTPYSNANPVYKVYHVDESVYTLVDSEAWTFNLTLANTLAPTELPEWYKLYSFRETFGVVNLQATQIGTIPEKMAQNHSLLDLYFTFQTGNSDPGISDGCDDDCKKKYLCDIVTTQLGDITQCEFYKLLYNNGS